MNDPVRLRDPGSGAPDELRRLFAAGAEDLPTAAELGRLATRLGPVFEPPPSSSPITLATAGKVAAVSTAVVGAAVFFALNFGPHGSRPPDAPERWVPPESAPPESSPRPTTSGKGAANSAAPESGSAAPAPPSEAAEPSSTAAASATAHAGSVNPRPESEAELLERARGSLAGNPARALALTEQDRARFPSGVLAQEREVIAIEALKRLGRTDEAARRAADFERRYPGSAYRKKLDTGRP
jgi:hypothetical protein